MNAYGGEGVQNSVMTAYRGDDGTAPQQHLFSGGQGYSTLQSTLPSPERVSPFFAPTHDYQTRKQRQASVVCATTVAAAPPIQFGYAAAPAPTVPEVAPADEQPLVGQANGPQEYEHVTAYDMGGPLVQAPPLP